jgi:hypothetical protein
MATNSLFLFGNVELPVALTDRTEENLILNLFERMEVPEEQLL